ncbi:ABC transporter substrate-binding protein [Clostridium sp. AM58-1XD]|uniref:ABC transporter substrate-binding protein n=1 Tax=Clostridium sp. AM58-1XD TaxID=2292307 RepID=UPI000E4C0765|nr:ABC transporter substrate-binding protein [Clostridium sp. AM58-1XD]RGY99287.1 extracellular solute-binding protein [Clostridium sp. AM58-1XD]
MKKRMLSVLCISAMALGLTACGGGKEAAPADNGAKEEVKSEAADTGDKKDDKAGGGKLIIYSPLTESMIDSMLSKFEEDTGIDAECLAMGTGDALKRIQTEADSPQADVLWSGTIGTVKNKSEYFADYTCVNEDAFYDEYKNTEGNLTRFDTIPSVIMVNTDLIGDIEIKGYEDLLNPELKGKIAFADPAASSSSFEHLVNMLYAMGEGNPENGWDYVKQFCAQLDGKLLGGSSAVYKGVADGEYTVGLTFEQGSAQYVGAGAPVKTVYMEEGVIFRGDGVYIIKGCPNEENAQKFVDWLTSQEVQEYMNNTQYRRTIRKDVPAGDSMEPMENISVIQDDETDTAEHKSEWLEAFKDIFTE